MYMYIYIYDLCKYIVVHKKENVDIVSYNM